MEVRNFKIHDHFGKGEEETKEKKMEMRRNGGRNPEMAHSKVLAFEAFRFLETDEQTDGYSEKGIRRSHVRKQISPRGKKKHLHYSIY